jgi:hypothetical protein
MAGVAGPMLRRSTAQGTRFLLGLLVGELLASALLALTAYLIGTVAALVAPLLLREVLTAVIVLGLGVADLMNRTPHIWRQVPQRFVRTMPPGRLGLVWGFDLGLLFTTQKSTSLTWVALVAATLLEPSASWLVLGMMAVVGVATVAIRSVNWSRRPLARVGDMSRPWFAVMRKVAGVGLLALAVVTAVGALPW